MPDITVEGLKKNFGAAEIFRDVTFRLEKKEKVGLVGSNGEGKTTIVRCILGLEEYDAGRVSTSAGVTLGYAAQGARVGGGSLWDELLTPGREIFSLRDQISDLSKRAAEETDAARQQTLLRQYTALEREYEHKGGYIYEQEIKKVAYGLGFTEEDLPRPAAGFSGGQKTRIALAGALLGQPDFLFLDEPTNHLDISMTEWLEKYLSAYRGGLLLISHDRCFLDRTVDKIFHLQGGRLKVYKGNYSRYARQKEEEDAARQAAYEKQREYITKAEEYIMRYKAGIKSRQARGRESQLARMERIAPPQLTGGFKLLLPKPPPSAEKALFLEGLAAGYGGKKLLRGLDLIIRQGEKVALVGANGAGKTTLLKIIAGEMSPLAGNARLGSRVKLGYFSQEHQGLFGGATVLTHIAGSYGLEEVRARTLLGGMLFSGDDVFKRLDDLSGGERARLALLKLLLDGANFLLLDEPTNHLDIKAREAVEAALCAWPGAVLLVSHDRYFLDRIAGRVWAIEDGSIADYNGNYSYYRAKKEEQLSDCVKPAPAPKAAALKNSAHSDRRGGFGAEQKLAAIELSLREQEALLLVLERRMADPKEHVSITDSQRLAEEHARLRAVIDGLMEEWEVVLHKQEKNP